MNRNFQVLLTNSLHFNMGAGLPLLTSVFSLHENTRLMLTIKNFSVPLSHQLHSAVVYSVSCVMYLHNCIWQTILGDAECEAGSLLLPLRSIWPSFLLAVNSTVNR